MQETQETTRRTGEFVRHAFAALHAHPEGLTIKEALAEVERRASLTEEERAQHPSKVLFRRFEVTTQFGAIAPTKAGWLRNGGSRWALTEEGRRAFERFTDPEEFLHAAARRSARGWLAVHAPRLYAGLTGAAYQALIEYRLVRRVGLRQLFGGTLKPAATWEDVLPVQTPRRLVVPDLELDAPEDLFARLGAEAAREGGHAFYLPPDAWRAGPLATAAAGYPSDAGLKIVKTPGGVDESSYVHASHKQISSLHTRLVHTHRHLSLVASLLHARGLGPRLYDLAEIQTGAHVFTAYVVAHAGGRTPTREECEAGVARLRALEAEGLLKVTMPDGYDDEDFECPSCNGNALTDDAGCFRYVDFQNFRLTGYEDYLKETALAAAGESHFGDHSFLRGGAYLYQAVPGVNLPSKRDPSARAALLSRLLTEAGVSVEGRLVLDVGCNVGMMIAQYLRLGARWCHGWDRARVVPHTERLLLALGCTRFTTTGGDLSPERPITEDVPAFLRESLEGCAVSYLAVRGYFGWLAELARIPWAFLIYEGHEHDTPSDFDEYMAELARLTPCRVAARGTYEDGDSDRRTVAIVVRES